ncbi:hypothetical protein phiMR25_gp18 [Staphylococcus phage phiMR25]|uniref:Uncharacterized protein n=1 Tax=Staphylococcus phage phiMR25 TaxID=487152 RepID=B2ZYV6_BPMR2|nr:hypothetical protein phiMR25_gp18 [Staphylococcus phage phiMR25]BAG48115.1 hypothetical protein [Staphylococcus phage phiMR25]
MSKVSFKTPNLTRLLIEISVDSISNGESFINVSDIFIPSFFGFKTALYLTAGCTS